METKRLDLVIFGATGFTGKYTVKHAQKLSKDYGFSWGVAGRRQEALQNVLKEFAPESENIPIIIADVKDEDSLKKMTERAKVIVNCCGPYRFYGEPVIKACISTKTHHVDVSGEPQFIERMMVEYNKAAQDAGIYVISACGFDSIPCDMGCIFAQQQFNGQINSIESYINSWSTTNAGGPSLNTGTWESAIYGAAHRNELRALRRKLYPNKLPDLKPKLVTKSVHRSAISPGWSVIFPGSDRAVAMSSQYFFYDKYKQRPIQIQTYFTIRSIFSFMALAVMGSIFLTLTKFSFGRTLLSKYPRFFSAGSVSPEGPKPETMENSYVSLTFKVSGWPEKLAEPTDNHADPPTKQMITKVTLRNPGYGFTCISLLLCAVTILNEANKMPDNGGVLPPGAAFEKTSLIESLKKNDVKFEVVSSN